MHYIYRCRDCIYAFYHKAGSGIVYRMFKSGRWYDEGIMIKAANPLFSLTQVRDTLYIFASDARGNITLTTIPPSRLGSSLDAVPTKVIMQSSAVRSNKVLIHPLIYSKGIALIYNSVSDSGGEEFRENLIMMRHMGADGLWDEANAIDRFASTRALVYEMQNVEADHGLVFYQTKSQDLQIGYREVTPRRYGDFVPVLATGYSVTDMSFLTTYEGIHFLFICKGMFSGQLVYRKRTDIGLSAPVIIYEGQRIEHCLLFYIKNRLHVTFMIGGQPYMCVSEDDGDSFSRPVRYTNKFCQLPMKAHYIDAYMMEPDMLFARQVYVDASRPWDVQMIPELYDDFLPTREAEIDYTNDRRREDLYDDEPPRQYEDEWSSWYGEASREMRQSESGRHPDMPRQSEPSRRPDVPRNDERDLMVELEAARRIIAEKEMKIAFLTQKLAQDQMSRARVERKAEQRASEHRNAQRQPAERQAEAQIPQSQPSQESEKALGDESESL